METELKIKHEPFQAEELWGCMGLRPLKLVRHWGW